MFRIGDFSFSPLARYSAPATDPTSAPVVFRPGGTRFPSIAFWRSRYGYADRSMQPQFAEWLAQDFQELEAYRFGLCIRVLDYLYEEPCGGSAEERETVLAELDTLVAAGEILQLRVCVAQPEYRHYRLQFFRDHTASNAAFWYRLALIYARLAPDADTIWCHALLEEARVLKCPAFTPELIAALVAMGPSERAEIDGEAHLPGEKADTESPLCPEASVPEVQLAGPVESGFQPTFRRNFWHQTNLFSGRQAGWKPAPQRRCVFCLPAILIASESMTSARTYTRAPPYRNTTTIIAIPKCRPFLARGPPESRHADPRTFLLLLPSHLGQAVTLTIHPSTHVAAHRWLRTFFDIFRPSSSACASHGQRQRNVHAEVKDFSMNPQRLRSPSGCLARIRI